MTRKVMLGGGLHAVGGRMEWGEKGEGRSGDVE